MSHKQTEDNNTTAAPHQASNESNHQQAINSTMNTNPNLDMNSNNNTSDIPSSPDNIAATAITVTAAPISTSSLISSDTNNSSLALAINDNSTETKSHSTTNSSTVNESVNPIVGNSSS